MESDAALSPAVQYHLDKRAGELFFRSQADETLSRISPDASPVLDLACGTAPLAPLFLARGQEYVGVDRDPAMVAGAVQRLAGGPGRVVLTEAGQLPFPDSSFDAVASLGLFEYLDSPVVVLAEIRRVLRPDGVAVLTVPRRDAPYRTAQALVAPILRVLGREDPFDLQSGHDVTRRELDVWAAEAGLTVEAEANVAPGVLPWPLDRLLPDLAAKLAGKAGSRYGTARLFLLGVPA